MKRASKKKRNDSKKPPVAKKPNSELVSGTRRATRNEVNDLQTVKFVLKLAGFMLVSFAVLTFTHQLKLARRRRRMEEDMQGDGKWLVDQHAQEIGLDTDICSIPKIHVSELGDSPKEMFEREYRGKGPLIIEGLIDDWEARVSWTRPNLLETMGDRPSSIGDAPHIVQTAGRQGQGKMTFGEYLEAMKEITMSINRQNETTSMDSDLFDFDASFLKSMPELHSDYATPSLFLPWGRNNPDASWHIFSLGATRSGLPFHTHGETWLALVFGKKRWFLYSPQESIPTDLHPLDGSWKFYQEVYPNLPENSPLLECVQTAGQVVYLPSGWKHLTVNIGEALGVGGQAAYDANERLKAGQQSLERYPNDLFALKAVGLAKAQIAMEKGDKKGLEEAVTHIQRAVEISPLHPEYSLLCSELLDVVGRHEEAVRVVEAFEARYESSEQREAMTVEKLTSVYSGIARGYMAIGESQRAILAADKAIQLGQEPGDAYLVKSDALKRLRKFTKAREVLEVALKASPDNGFFVEALKELPN